MTLKNSAETSENGLGDLEKTVLINALIQTPITERDPQWIATFLANIADANLKLGAPEVVIASDGFPYVQLETVSSNENFQAFVISKQLPTLLLQGFGIVINAQDEQPDWIFTYGDIANFELNDAFYTDNHIFSAHRENVVIGSDEKILIGQPSDNILPKYIRKQLREFLQHAGVQSPKTMLIARNFEDEAQVKQDLVFNFTPAQFASEQDFQQIGNTVSWFLPRHYSILFIDDMSIENGFQEI
ncbi:hypothetical protein [Sphingobacterium paucimobilis]|uniref:Uncharacterized protein n=1 Tax=Sphingobacterium paucimobilis HER1398 TaxID=1346330 RepID=U2J4X7_9SPHI|nr:hypothetical protein [Sphingobacterium paucimobilis]ERJ59994.1 hypothetical protein M472_14590 [Sphingobacterium paucimobilis HER1398]